MCVIVCFLCPLGAIGRLWLILRLGIFLRISFIISVIDTFVLWIILVCFKLYTLLFYCQTSAFLKKNKKKKTVFKGFFGRLRESVHLIISLTTWNIIMAIRNISVIWKSWCSSMHRFRRFRLACYLLLKYLCFSAWITMAPSLMCWCSDLGCFKLVCYLQCWCFRLNLLNSFLLGHFALEHASPQLRVPSWTIYEPRHDKTNKMSVRPAKTQISVGIRPVWSESSLHAQWVAKNPSFLLADSEDSDQTGRTPRLIWVFAGRTAILLVLSCRGSYCPDGDVGN